MAIDCHDGQTTVPSKTPVHSLKLIKPLESVDKTAVEAGIPKALLQNKDGHWAKLLLKGTATETKDSSALGISIIAQPECENNQEICPTSQEGPLYITDSKQYSLTECNEHIPNNVVNATEGKLAQSPRFPKSKKKRRKRSVKNNNATTAIGSQTTPEQETRTPIPVQDEESQSKQWHTSGIQPTNENIQYPPPNSQPYAYDNLKVLHKLISPCQCIYHVGAGKLQPPSNLLLDQSSKIITALGTDDYEKFNLQRGSFKFSNSFTDSKTQSVEEGVLFALKDSVSFGEPYNLCTLAKSWKNDYDREQEVNEGILLDKGLRTQDYEYKTNIHWTKSEEVLGSGAFGDVFLGKDKETGFKFAAKTINVDRFRSEELTCCLAVNSEKIIPVYGAVREGSWITVFIKHMEGGSLGQLIKRSGFLAEDWALYYTGQVLQGLKHLHAANIVHGDIKADNVLLSDHGKTAYLCDFGHAAHLPPGGCKIRLLTGDYVPGTETHMAPEIVRGEPCDTKLDVWSACCMLLHMLNGWHPWSRTHKAPLCLKIATEPPPLQEIPPNCQHLTQNLIVDGLRKDPSNRADALDLIYKVDIALQKIGGLKSPYNSEYREPRIFPSIYTDVPVVPGSQLKAYHEEAVAVQSRGMQQITEDASLTSQKSVEQARRSCEVEIERLERDLYMDNLSQPYFLEEHEQMFLSEQSLEPLHSRKDSMTTLDTKSSGIHSWDSQMEPWSLQSDSFFSGGNTATPSWFNGVKVHLQSFSGEILYIWESGRTKLGDLAVGISSQIPIESFTIVNSKGTPIPHNTDISDCGTELQVSLALDRERWLWRVKKGKIEEGKTGEVYTGGGTDAPTFVDPRVLSLT
ncbi:mitogen-activated protein kinase kinase kinase 14 [Bufo gargarizans]|uniref:mitogen-activated protein kinase kinase kinase 14 n=1 Tax=Bufo gargarizans TaxID=30331 RepID=UPI001CF3F5AA|nr:mitogen-activated protein kinase kinase kinase 14 [Bufo gargarizans]